MEKKSLGREFGFYSGIMFLRIALFWMMLILNRYGKKLNLWISVYELRVECFHTDRRINSYAVVTAAYSSTRLSIEIDEISLDWDEMERKKELMKNEGKYVFLNMPPGTTESVTRKTLFHRTMNSTTKKIENVPTSEVEQTLDCMSSEITFINRGKQFWTIGIKFEKKEAAKGYALQNIKTDKWWSFPLYMGWKLAIISVDAISPDIKPEWAVTTITPKIKIEYRVVNINKM